MDQTVEIPSGPDRSKTRPRTSTKVLRKKMQKTRSFVDALKEKYCSPENDSHCEFIIDIVIRGKPKNNGHTSAELAHLRNIVLSNRRVSTGGLPESGLASLCPNVSDLDLSSNLLESWIELLPMLSQLPHLKFLNLSRNHITRHKEELWRWSTPLPKLENVVLNNTGVPLREVLALARLMPALRELHICCNYYRDLGSVEVAINEGALAKLECLRLNENIITSWSEVWKLRNLPCLTQLILSENPLCDLFFDPCGQLPDTALCEMDSPDITCHSDGEDSSFGSPRFRYPATKPLTAAKCKRELFPGSLSLSPSPSDRLSTMMEHRTDRTKQQTDNAKQQTDNAKQQTDNTKQQTDNAKQQTDNAKQQTDNAKQQTDNAKQQTDNTKQQTDNAKQQTDNAKQQTDNAKQQTDNAKQQTDNAKQQTDNAKQQTDNAKQQTDNAKQQTDIDNAIQQTDNAKQQTDNAKQQTDNAKQQTDNAKQQTDNAKQQTDNAKQQTDNAKQQTDNAKQQTDIAKQQTDNANKQPTDDPRQLSHDGGKSQMVIEILEDLISHICGRRSSQESCEQCRQNTDKDLQRTRADASARTERADRAEETTNSDATRLENDDSGTQRLDLTARKLEKVNLTAKRLEKVALTAKRLESEEDEPQFMCDDLQPAEETNLNRSSNNRAKFYLEEEEEEEEGVEERCVAGAGGDEESENFPEPEPTGMLTGMPLGGADARNIEVSQEQEDQEESSSPFTKLHTLCLSRTSLCDLDHLHSLNQFPCLRSLKIMDIALFSDIHQEDRRKLLVASLPTVQMLNGSEVTLPEREKAERHFLRHFMDAQYKTSRYTQLEEKHGPAQPLFDIDLGARFHKQVTLTFMLSGKEQFRETVSMLQPVGKLRTFIARKMAIPKNQRSQFRMFHRACGPYQSPADQAFDELFLDSLPLSRFDFLDGDQLHVELPSDESGLSTSPAPVPPMMG